MPSRWSAQGLGESGELSVKLAELLGEAKKQVGRIDEESLIHEHEAILLECLLAEHALELVEIDETRIQRSALRESPVGVQDFFGGQMQVPGFSMDVEVPLSGAWQLLAYRASTRTLSGSPGQVDDGHAILLLEGRSPDAEEIRRKTEHFLQRLRDHVGWLNADLEGFNARLKQEVEKALKDRKGRVHAAREVEAALAIPLKRVAANEPRSIETRRRIIRPSQRTHARAAAPAWVLDAAQYADVLQVCKDWITGMQRSPRSVASLSEEGLRDLLLTTLNTHWEGAAAGEVFNGAGKTDILVRYENRQVFIGECKVWSGSKAAGEAIDQLLRYLTWEDCKAALIVFIKTKRPQQAITKLTEAVVNHQKVLAKVPDVVEGVNQYVVDAAEGRRIELAVLPVVLTASRDQPAEG